MIYDPVWGTSERPDLPDRLQSFSRYVALVAEQLEAAQRHDSPRVRELEEERARLEGALDHSGDRPDPETRLSSLLNAGLRELEDQDGLRREEHEVWLHLENGALRAAQALRSDLPRTGRYQDYSVAAARVDVRF